MLGFARLNPTYENGSFKIVVSQPGLLILAICPITSQLQPKFRLPCLDNVNMTKANLYLCMGSACHQLGVYEVLPKLQALMQEYNLEATVELKGSFCLETCSQGIVMRFQDLLFTDINPQNIETKFLGEILPAIQETTVTADS